MTDNLLLICQDCGAAFFTPGEKAFYESRGLLPPKRCKSCREARKHPALHTEKKTENEEREKPLSQARVPSKYRMADIKAGLLPGAPHDTLYVIGNGFDLMHGVKSRYYDFRDTLGKTNPLRTALEDYINVADIWADLEDSLAHISSSQMYGALDMFLEDFNAYDPDAQAADFFLAVDAATGPAATITEQLPRRFRMWVESLALPDMNKPLAALIHSDALCLCFNYTEFAETLYGLKRENICYIHGNRRKEKYHPKEKLIIGHAPGAADGDYDPQPRLPCYKSKRKSAVLEAAINSAAQNLNWYDEEITKYSPDIIKAHRSFFDSLGSVRRIIVIGHSLSPVDWDYYREIIRQSSAPEKLEWYISIHSVGDLDRLNVFAGAMKIDSGRITVFCV